MKSLTTILMSVALATSVVAGPVGSAPKNAKAPVAPAPAPAGCGCFGPGLSADVFGGAYLPEFGDEVLGGGVGLNYFFSRNVGIDVNYGLYATDKEHHQFDANLILRAPIDSLCIAPYVLVGGGVATNSVTRGNYQVGGGLDVRIPSASCLGIFAEGAYHFSEEEPDYTTVRLGLRIPF